MKHYLWIFGLTILGLAQPVEAGTWYVKSFRDIPEGRVILDLYTREADADTLVCTACQSTKVVDVLFLQKRDECESTENELYPFDGRACLTSIPTDETAWIVISKKEVDGEEGVFCYGLNVCSTSPKKAKGK